MHGFYFKFRCSVCLVLCHTFYMRVAHCGMWRRASRPPRSMVTLATSWASLSRTTRALSSLARATLLPRRGHLPSFTHTHTHAHRHSPHRHDMPYIIVPIHKIHLAYVQLWDIREGMCTQTFAGHESDINAIGVHYCLLSISWTRAYNSYE